MSLKVIDLTSRISDIREIESSARRKEALKKIMDILCNILAIACFLCLFVIIRMIAYLPVWNISDFDRGLYTIVDVVVYNMVCISLVVLSFKTYKICKSAVNTEDEKTNLIVDLSKFLKGKSSVDLIKISDSAVLIQSGFKSFKIPIKYVNLIWNTTKSVNKPFIRVSNTSIEIMPKEKK